MTTIELPESYEARLDEIAQRFGKSKERCIHETMMHKFGID